MIGRALARGVRDAARRPGLVTILWGWNLVLAGLVTVPFLAWIYGASGVSPMTDRLLDGVDLGLVVELVGAGGQAPVIVNSVVALAIASLLSGAFLSGGILEVLTTDGDGRPLLHRFFRGAGRFFGRFTRLLLIAAATAVPITGLVAAGLSAATRPLASGGSEPASLWGSIGVLAGVGLAIAWFLLALDYARAATVISGSRSMLRAWVAALGFVVRRAPAAASIGIVGAVGVAAALGVAVAFDATVGGRAWSAILGTVLVHQAMTFVRTAVRVGQVSAQASYWKGLQPVVEPAAEPGPPPGGQTSVQSMPDLEAERE